MWSSLKQAIVKFKIHSKVVRRQYSNESQSSKLRTVAIAVAATGAGLASTIIYAKYDLSRKSLIERDLLHINQLYKLILFGVNDPKSIISLFSTNEEKNVKIPSDLSKDLTKFQKYQADSESKITTNKLENKPDDPIDSSSEKQNSTFQKNLLIDLIKELESSCDETKSAFEDAAEAVKKHFKLLYIALNLSDDLDRDIAWKQAYVANFDRNTAVKNAQEKALNTKALAEKLEFNSRNIAITDSTQPLIEMCEDAVKKVAKELYNFETKMKSVENDTKTFPEYQKLVNKGKNFKRELEIMLPNYVHGLDDNKTGVECDLNTLIARAHQRIEQLQMQIAKRQVTERTRIDKALRQEKLSLDSIIADKAEAELEKRKMEIEIAVAKKVKSLEENFESELRKLLHFQAAAHLDHVQEVLKVHEQELERKYLLDSEEKLLHMKGVFTSEVSDSIARLEKLLTFLKTKTELDVKSNKAKSLWLSCQSLSEKISSGSSYLTPLKENVAAIKLSAGEENVYVKSVLAGIPDEAVMRGVYSAEVLKQKFCDVKKVCRKVAMIDESNDSLYRYLLSHLQSYFIIDEVSIPKAEPEGKVAVNSDEWDTFDILSRISYSLKTDDLVQALRYANKLKGEPKAVAKDWIKELKLFLETQIVIKALSAHASAINVQAYH